MTNEKYREQRKTVNDYHLYVYWLIIQKWQMFNWNLKHGHNPKHFWSIWQVRECNRARSLPQSWRCLLRQSAVGPWKMNGCVSRVAIFWWGQTRRKCTVMGKVRVEPSMWTRLKWWSTRLAIASSKILLRKPVMSRKASCLGGRLFLKAYCQKKRRPP